MQGEAVKMGQKEDPLSRFNAAGKPSTINFLKTTFCGAGLATGIVTRSQSTSMYASTSFLACGQASLRRNHAKGHNRL